MPVTDWNRPLEKPIIKKDGSKVVTLLDAYKVLLDLPKKKQREPLPQALARVFIDAAEGRGSINMAQAAAAVAVNGTPKPAEGPRKKPARKYKVLT